MQFRTPTIVGLLALGTLSALVAGSGSRLGAATAESLGDRTATPTLASSTEYQADLSDSESAQAIAIAQAATDRAASSAEIGRAILAYPSDGDAPFFVDRIVYVTFHPSATADPTAGVWVDLSTGQIASQWSNSSPQLLAAPVVAPPNPGIGLLGQPGPQVQWGGWSMTTEVSGNEEGLALRDVRYGGHLIASKLSMPVMTVVYEAGLCGPFADRIGRPLLDIDWANGASMVYRELTIDGLKWRELGVRNQIGDYDLYQSYLFSPTGVIEARLSGSGLQCLANHEHFPTFYVHTDIDGGHDDRVTSLGGAVATTEADAGVAEGWQVVDPTSKTRVEFGPARLALPGPASGGTPVDAGQTIGIRRYRPIEDAGWRWGAQTSFFPYGNGEALGGDVAIWYQTRMGHQATDGAAHWHTTGMRLTVRTDRVVPALAAELNNAATATESAHKGALRG